MTSTRTIQVQHTVKGIKVTLRGTVPTILDVGEYKLPANFNMSMDWLYDWLSQTGLDGMSKEAAVVRRDSIELFRLGRFFLPTLSEEAERLQLFVQYLIFLKMADEHEEMRIMRSGASKLTQLMADLVADILRDKYENIADLPDVPTSTLPLFRALFSILERSKSIFHEFHETREPMVNALHTSVITNSRLGLPSVLSSPQTFKYLKTYSGSEVVLELATLTLGFTLPASMRQDVLFQRAMRLASGLLTYFDDLNELSKEDKAIESTNIIQNIQVQRNCSVTDAFEDVTKDIEGDITELHMACTTLKTLNRRNLRLAKYLKTIQTVIEGSVSRFIAE